MTESLRRTPLHDQHLALGAKMVSFAGWEMPVQYPGGIRAEHQAVREAAGLFDVSHMGEFTVEGPGALALVQHVSVNDASRLAVGQAQYSALCREDGGVLDDILAYRTGESDFLLVVNAANRASDLEWILGHGADFDAQVADRSDDYALLALQGPRAAEILTGVTDMDLEEVGYFRFARGSVAGAEGVVARTGYTGEDGFELYLPADAGAVVWRTLLESGETAGLAPAGLGARDTLRLEVGYPLYGNDLDTEHTALEGGLGWAVKLDKGDFLGREALARQKEEGVSRKLSGIVLGAKGFPRPGYEVVYGGEVVGALTSGTMSPSLDQGIALAYLPTEIAAEGTGVAVRIRDKDIPGRVQRPPFYRDGSIRR
jgi:aminomethyltransferase